MLRARMPELEMLKACLNGARRPGEHPALPVTAEELGHDAAAVRTARADAVHLHVKDDHGSDTMAAGATTAALTAVRATAPGLPVGVTTGAWMLPDPAQRLAAIRHWRTLPDFASVNWHEDGADDVAALLLDRGIGVEAGLWHEDAVLAWIRSPLRDRCLRVLIELPDGIGAPEVPPMADRLLALVRGATGDRLPLLLHGEGSSAWPALAHARQHGLATRMGLEDTLSLPDGSPARDNAELIEHARRPRRGAEDLSGVED